MQYPLVELIKHHIMIENIDNEEVPLCWVEFQCPIGHRTPRFARLKL